MRGFEDMHESSMMTRSAPGEVLGLLGEQSSPGARAAPALPIPISDASLLASKTAINDRPTQGQASSYASMVKKIKNNEKKALPE